MWLHWQRWGRPLLFAIIVIGVLATEMLQTVWIHRLRSELDDAKHDLARVESSVDDVDSRIGQLLQSSEAIDVSEIQTAMEQGFLEVHSQLSSVESQITNLEGQVADECGKITNFGDAPPNSS